MSKNVEGVNRLDKRTNVVQINEYIRKKVAFSVSKRLDEIVDKALLYQTIEDKLTRESGQTQGNLFEVLREIDLTMFFKGVSALDKPFECLLVKGRHAWIHKNDKGHYRYYSRKNTSIFSFDIIDLLSIFRNESKNQVLNFIQEKWEVDGFTPWYAEQKQKYDDNRKLLNEVKQNKDKYPYLHKIVKKHWGFIEILNDFASEKIMGQDNAVHNQSVFFISNNYLKETYFPDRSISTVNNLINLFCVLGFMSKVPKEQLPKALLKKAEVYFKVKKVNNYTSYYLMHNWEDVIDGAELRAKILFDNRIYYHRITKKVIKELFGEDFMEKIYVQQTYGRKPKAEPVFVKEQDMYYTESERLENKFIKEINTTGKCAKSTLFKSSYLPYLRFNKLWNSIIKKYNCREKYPTKNEIQRYGLRSRLLIAIPQRINEFFYKPKPLLQIV